MEPLQNIKLTFKCPKQLNELQPCNGDWYCDGCQKIVHDFRGMTETQVAHAFAASDYRMCGIFEADRIQVVPQQNKWLKWVSAAMLALGMTGLYQRIYAQTTLGVDTISNKYGKVILGGAMPLPGQKFSKEAIKRSQKDIADNMIFGGVGVDPEFVGGEAALRKYLQANLKNTQHLFGKVYAQFVVGKDGRITNVTIIRSDVPTLDNEVIRVLKAMPKWRPGIQNGKPASVQYTLPVSFLRNK